MERARELRENAARCLRLSASINVPTDVAWLEALAAEATQAAERLEAEEAAGVIRAGPGTVQGIDALTHRGAELDPAALTDRRRAGRRDDVSPVLIPLLREASNRSVLDEPTAGGPDNLGASRGIIIWTLISAAVWLPLALWIVGRGR
jgi:hypothetical protein